MSKHVCGHELTNGKYRGILGGPGLCFSCDRKNERDKQARSWANYREKKAVEKRVAKQLAKDKKEAEKMERKEAKAVEKAKKKREKEEKKEEADDMAAAMVMLRLQGRI